MHAIPGRGPFSEKSNALLPLLANIHITGIVKAKAARTTVLSLVSDKARSRAVSIGCCHLWRKAGMDAAAALLGYVK